MIDEASAAFVKSNLHAAGLTERRRPGRTEDVSPALLPLLRSPATIDRGAPADTDIARRGPQPSNRTPGCPPRWALTGWMSARLRDGWTRTSLAVFLPLGAIWLVCLSATVALGTSAQVSAAVAADVSRIWTSLGLPFAVDGVRVTSIMFTKLLLVSVAVLPVLTIEAAICGARDCSIGRLMFNRTTSAVYDWLTFALNLVSVWKLFELVFSLGGLAIVSGLLARMVSAIAGGGWRLNTGYLIPDCILAFIAFTLSDYCGHRFLHTRVFFPLHRMHHTATEMSVVTLWRNNPGVAIIEALYKVWPLAFFDIPFGAVTGIWLGMLAYENLIHSKIDWTWGWFGRWILHPPRAHLLHHSVDPLHSNSNFGTIVLWDRVFGTWLDPRTATGLLGAEGSQTNTGNFFGEMIGDLRVFAFDQWRRSSR